MSSKDLRVTLSGVTLDNPVIPASGTYGFGQEFTPYYDINILGSLSFKGTTAESRFGNPTPPSSNINAVGLQNPGVEHVIAHELPALRKIFHKPIIANISGFSVEEYVHCVELLTKEEQVEILEINISCPNVRHGGMAFGTNPDAAAEITRQASGDEACLHEAVAERDGHCVHRESVRRRGRGRLVAHQHPAGDAH